MIGETIGNYRILERIGAGGMGEVYLAQHQRLARKAAIKVLLPDLSSNAQLVDRFFTEARATSLIRHRGIVEILDCDVHQGRAFIVMEYLEGENLAACLRRTGSLINDLPAAVSIIKQIAQALTAAHARGIVHRDLKPDNIFLVANPDTGGALEVKILDFGIAKLLGTDGESATSRTRTGSLVGTPLYMSPEQCRGVGAIDQRTDIYSLGCIVCELVTGRPPFVRESPGDLVVAHLTEAPPVPSSIEPRVPPAIDALVGQMLAKIADQRPATMVAVEAALGYVDLGGTRPVSSPSTLIPGVPGGTSIIPTPVTNTTLQRAAREVRNSSAGPRGRGLLVWGIAGAAVLGGILVSLLGRLPTTPARPATTAPVVDSTPKIPARPDSAAAVQDPAPPAGPATNQRAAGDVTADGDKKTRNNDPRKTRSGSPGRPGKKGARNTDRDAITDI